MTRDTGLGPVPQGRPRVRTARASGQGLCPRGLRQRLPQGSSELEAQPLPLEPVAKGWAGPMLAQCLLPHCSKGGSSPHLQTVGSDVLT